jgi:hypothetical protein
VGPTLKLLRRDHLLRSSNRSGQGVVAGRTKRIGGDHGVKVTTATTSGLRLAGSGTAPNRRSWCGPQDVDDCGYSTSGRQHEAAVRRRQGPRGPVAAEPGWRGLKYRRHLNTHVERPVKGANEVAVVWMPVSWSTGRVKAERSEATPRMNGLEAAVVDQLLVAGGQRSRAERECVRAQRRGWPPH